jgi:hypothetical protein
MKTTGSFPLRVGLLNASLPRRCAVAIVAACVLAVSSGADPAGTRVLFDGKSLDGWKKTDFANAGEVRVEDGTLILKAGQSMTGITTTRKDLPRVNYELSYEAKRLTGNDFFAAATFPINESYLTFVNGGWGGSVTGLSSLDGSDASENDSSRFFKYEDKTWYRFRVRVTGTMIRCAIDGKEVVAINHEGRKLSTRLETRSNQPLGFATWDTGGAIRKIEVRMLTPAEIAATNKTE